MIDMKFRYRLIAHSDGEIITEVFNIEEIEGRILRDWCEHYEVLSRDRFTGLKDKNGKEICGGDLVNYDGDVCEIYYWHGSFCVEKVVTNYSLLMDCHRRCEIIGNLYDNLDLISLKTK